MNCRQAWRSFHREQANTVVSRISYHAIAPFPCHLRALGIGYPAAKLMSLIPDLEYEILDDNCCGLSGSYGFKKSNESTAIQIGNRAVAHINKTGVGTIVADCGSCRMQLGGLSGLVTLDPAKVISEALGITLAKKIIRQGHWQVNASDLSV